MSALPACAKKESDSTCLLYLPPSNSVSEAVRKAIPIILLFWALTGSAQTYAIDFPEGFSYLNAHLNLKLNYLVLGEAGSLITLTFLDHEKILPDLKICEGSTIDALDWENPLEKKSFDPNPLRQKSGWPSEKTAPMWDGFYDVHPDTQEKLFVNQLKDSKTPTITQDTQSRIVSIERLPLVLLVYDVSQKCWTFELHHTNLSRDQDHPGRYMATFYLLNPKKHGKRHFVNLPIILTSEK